jgi:hypothetical protein
MTKWEYCIVQADNNVNDALEQYGLDGWELCAVDNVISPTGLYFKRPADQPAAAPPQWNCLHHPCCYADQCHPDCTADQQAAARREVREKFDCAIVPTRRTDKSKGDL